MSSVDIHLVKRFMDLFRGRTDYYGHRDFRSGNTWSEGARDENGQLILENGSTIKPPPLTIAQYQDHLEHVQGLRIIPITPDGNIWFACIDIDKDDIDHVELARRIEEFGFPLYVFVSKSNAAHLYIFFDGIGKPAEGVIKRLKEYALALGCERDLPKAEIFPVQASLEGGSQGNAINLPLFNCHVDPDNKVGKMVDAQGRYYNLEEALSKIEVWSSKRKLMLPLRTVGFDEGPPCLETLHNKDGFPPGQRNKGMYNVGVFMKKAFPEDWEERLEAYNRKFVAGTRTDKEIGDIIRSLKKRDYQYKCSEDPIASVCEKALCRSRLYGIKTKEERIEAEADKIPLPITALKKYNTEPVEYALQVSGIWIRLSAGQLMNYTALRVFLLAAMNILPPQMTAKHWEAKLQGLLKKMQFIDVSEDSGNHKLALDMIDNLVQNGRHNSIALINDECWLDWQEAHMGSYAYLTMLGLRLHLINMKNPIDIAPLAVLLHMSEWESVSVRVNGKTTRVWRAFYPGIIAADHPTSREGRNAERKSRGITSDVSGSEAHDTISTSKADRMHQSDGQPDGEGNKETR